MNCDIIIPVWNQLEFTKGCIDSIFKNTDGSYGLIIIDNASDSQTALYLDSLKQSRQDRVSVVRNDKNTGFIKAVNQGIELSRAPYVCVLNNDTLVTKNWLKEMLNVAQSQNDIGIVNPSSNNLGQRPDRGEDIEDYAHRLEKESGKFVELGSAIGFCMLIKKGLIEKIGPFDEIYGMGNFEDTDFSRRAVKEGYRCVRACGAYVYHRESSSFSKVRTFDDDFKRNKEIYEFRWGRPKRIAYIIGPSDDNLLRRLNAESIKSARAGNWIWYFSKSDIAVPAHSNIIYKKLPSQNFYIRAVYNILKKKKKFNEISVSEKGLGRILEYLSFIHKAEVTYC